MQFCCGTTGKFKTAIHRMSNKSIVIHCIFAQHIKKYRASSHITKIENV